jgi:hypothetical protein
MQNDVKFLQCIVNKCTHFLLKNPREYIPGTVKKGQILRSIQQSLKEVHDVL